MRYSTMGGVNWSTRDLAGAYKRLGSPCPITDACGDGRRSKYGVDNSPSGKEARTVDGILFDSKAEAKHYPVLKIAEAAGFITGLVLQPKFMLQAKFTDSQGRKHRASYYVSDFQFTRDGKTIAADCKGFKTAQYRDKIKRAILQYPEIEFQEWK